MVAPTRMRLTPNRCKPTVVPSAVRSEAREFPRPFTLRTNGGLHNGFLETAVLTRRIEVLEAIVVRAGLVDRALRIRWIGDPGPDDPGRGGM